MTLTEREKELKEEVKQALIELGATPVPFVCNDDGDIDYHHLRDDKPEWFTIIERALKSHFSILEKASEIRNAVLHSNETYEPNDVLDIIDEITESEATK